MDCAELLVAGGNMEGKEVRFGVGGSTLTGVVTSNAATGSYNAMADSFTALGGGVLLLNMMLGEIVFGGLGTGVSSLVMFALVVVFLAGLMVGRTPEYIGKRFGPAETKLIMFYALDHARDSGTAGRRRRRDEGRPGPACRESGAPWVDEYSGGLRLFVREQRAQLRRTQREHCLLQRIDGARHVAGSIWADDSRAASGGPGCGAGSIAIDCGTLRTDSFMFAGLLIGMVLVFAGLSSCQR